MHGPRFGVGSVSVLRRRISALTGTTTKKNTAVATDTNVISAFRNEP